MRAEVQDRALSPEQLIAQFQRRRRRCFRILRWTTGIGFGAFFGGLLLLHSLPRLKAPPYWLFAGLVASMVVLAAGALYAPHLYRCPICHRRIHVPDETEAGYTLLKDPAACPHCGVRLKAAGSERGRFGTPATFVLWFCHKKTKRTKHSPAR